MQYTIRQVPKKLDQALRRKAKSEGKSINRFLIDHLTETLGAQNPQAKKRDLSDIAGTWVDDPGFDAAIKEFDQIEPDMWK